VLVLVLVLVLAQFVSWQRLQYKMLVGFEATPLAH
jgi:hypothetical protein